MFLTNNTSWWAWQYPTNIVDSISSSGHIVLLLYYLLCCGENQSPVNTNNILVLGRLYSKFGSLGSNWRGSNKRRGLLAKESTTHRLQFIILLFRRQLWRQWPLGPPCRDRTRAQEGTVWPWIQLHATPCWGFRLPRYREAKCHDPAELVLCSRAGVVDCCNRLLWSFGRVRPALIDNQHSSTRVGFSWLKGISLKSRMHRVLSAGGINTGICLLWQQQILWIDVGFLKTGINGRDVPTIPRQ